MNTITEIIIKDSSNNIVRTIRFIKDNNTYYINDVEGSKITYISFLIYDSLINCFKILSNLTNMNISINKIKAI